MSQKHPNRAAAKQRLKPHRLWARKTGAASSAAPVFAALGDKTRLSLVARLSGGQPHSISQLTHGAKLTRQAITKHLRVLESAGIVRSTPAGRENHFQLNPQSLQAMRQYLDSVSKQWDQTLTRLKSFVEG
jgi:DNA-binding transcriptional ArsR family regulator